MMACSKPVQKARIIHKNIQKHGAMLQVSADGMNNSLEHL
jgi:hypothetical protein